MDGQTDRQNILGVLLQSIKKFKLSSRYAISRSEVEEIQSDVNHVQKLKIKNDWRIWNIENDQNVIFVKNDY